MKMTLNQMLVELDGFESTEGIIVIGATNLPNSLDSALVRPGRFDRNVQVPNPDVEGRRQILELYLQKIPMAVGTKLLNIARGTAGFSGAELFNLVNMAALKAALDDKMEVGIAELEFAKDKILMGAERKSAVLSDESKKLTAYHEAGHAIMALYTDGATPIHKATIVPRGQALGMVSQLPDKDETSISMHQLLARLDVCMGGRVAEELIFGDRNVTSGASSDLDQATNVAKAMVTKYGMNEKIGPICIDLDDPGLSTDTKRLVEEEVLKMLNESYTRTQDMLRKFAKQHHMVANALLEHETLTGDELRALVGEGLRKPTLEQREAANAGGGGGGSKAAVPAGAAGKDRRPLPEVAVARQAGRA
jgi:ATP-dependent metalloprotease